MILIIIWLVLFVAFVGYLLYPVYHTFADKQLTKWEKRREPPPPIAGFPDLSKPEQVRQQIKDWQEQDMEFATDALQYRLDYWKVYDEMGQYQTVKQRTTGGGYIYTNLTERQLDEVKQMSSTAQALAQEYNRRMKKPLDSVPPRGYTYPKTYFPDMWHENMLPSGSEENQRLVLVEGD